MTGVVAVLADAWGMQPASVNAAARREPSIRDRVDQLHEDPDTVDIGGLHADVKLTMLDEPLRGES